MSQITTNSPLEQFRHEAQRLMQHNKEQRSQQVSTETDPVQQYADSVSLGNSADTAALYGADMKTEGNDPLELLRTLVVKTFEEQGLATTISMGEESVDIESLTPEQAQDLIAEDGYFGVEKTSERIFKAAIGIAGNDPSRLDAILEGIEDGFAEAEQAFGGTLPDISYQTRDAVIEKLNAWAEENNPAAG